MPKAELSFLQTAAASTNLALCGGVLVAVLFMMLHVVMAPPPLSRSRAMSRPLNGLSFECSVCYRPGLQTNAHLDRQCLRASGLAVAW